MLYKKQGKPVDGEVVICTVKKIISHSVFVNLDEYENIEGMIHISEIAPGRIRNLRDYVKEGKRIVCKVLNINSRGNIDLSLRRVGTTSMVNKLNECKQEEKAEKLLESVGKQNNIDLKKMYDIIGYKAIEKYGSLYALFQKIVNGKESILTDFTIDKKVSENLYKIVKEKIKQPEVSISGILTLKSNSFDGVEKVKKILLEIQKKGITVSYLGAPKYKLEVKANDYKKAEFTLKEGLDIAEQSCKKSLCEHLFIKNG